MSINNLISILKVIENPKDNHNLAKILFVNFLNIDSYQAADILEKFNFGNRSGKKALFDFLLENTDFKNLTNKIKNLKTKSANMNFDIFFKEFLNDIGYIEHILKNKDNRYGLIKIDKLFDEIKRQAQNQKGYSLSDFIKFIDAYQKYNLDIETQDPEVLEGVELMTAHKSKGLEFEFVYIVSATRKAWEKSRGFPKIALPLDESKGDIDDERRLFYVSMTRAKKDLCITSSRTDSEGKPLDKSQFVTEIDENLIENIDTTQFEKENLDDLKLFIMSNNSNKRLFDKEYLQKLFATKNLNVSALNNYIECPNKYLFRNLINLPDTKSSSLIFGDCVHDALEKFFEESRNLKKIASKNVLIKYFKNIIDKSVLYGSEYERYLERGEGSLSEYYDKYHKNWSVEIENEKYIKTDFKLDNGEVVNLSGRLDKIEFLDESLEGRINIIDYKTGKSFNDKSKKIEKEALKRQLVFYHILYENFADGKFRINQAVLDFIEKNKDDEFEQYSVPISAEEIREVKDEINKMVSEVVSGEFLSLGCNLKDCEYCNLRKTIS